jgi:hypothetical protein
MDLRTGVIGVLLISGLTVACGSRTTAPTDTDRNNSVESNTSTGGPLPPTAPLPPAGSCDASKAQFALGERASQELLDRARVAAGARDARFIRPNEAITLEFLPTRLNLNLNTKDVVHSLYCG